MLESDAKCEGSCTGGCGAPEKFMLVPSMMSAFNKSDIGKLRARTAAHCEQRVFESRCFQLNTDRLAYQIHLRKLSLRLFLPCSHRHSCKACGLDAR